MPSILECNRIVGSIYPYSLNFATLFTSHLSGILALFFSKSLVKLLLHDKRSSILNQVLLFHQLFHYHKCSYGQVGWYGAVVKTPCPEACMRSGELCRLCIRNAQLTQFS